MPSHREYEISYPFGAALQPYSSMNKAFRSSKLSPEQNKGLAYGLMCGARVDELVMAKYSGPLEIGMSAQPNTEHLAKALTEQSVRKRWREWRKVLFGNAARAGYFYKYASNYLESEGDGRIVISNIGEILQRYGLFDGLEPDEYRKRLNIWKNLRACLYECPRGFTVGKFRKKTTGHTYYQMALTNWRTFLEEHEGINKYQKKFKAQYFENTASQEYLNQELGKKVSCAICQTDKILTAFYHIICNAFFSSYHFIGFQMMKSFILSSSCLHLFLFSVLKSLKA